MCGEPLASPSGQVEHEKRQVVGDVELTQLAIELDAVDDAYSVTEKNVLGAQVAVSIADESAARTLGERLGVRRNERVCKPLDCLHPSNLAALLDVSEELMQIPVEPALGR